MTDSNEIVVGVVIAIEGTAKAVEANNVMIVMKVVVIAVHILLMIVHALLVPKKAVTIVDGERDVVITMMKNHIFPVVNKMISGRNVSITLPLQNALNIQNLYHL